MVKECPEEFLANYSHLGHDFGLYENENGVVRCKGQVANVDLS